MIQSLLEFMNQHRRLMSAELSGSVWFVSSLLLWSHNSSLAVDGLCRADHSANPLIVCPRIKTLPQIETSAPLPGATLYILQRFASQMGTDHN